LDQQHDGVVLMVESFCSRASPTRSRERERERGQQLAARVWGEERAAPLPPLIKRGGRPRLAWPLPNP
jgi:hypothetical protein